METLKKVCTHVLILATATSLFACNLATIHEPLGQQRYSSEPVDIFVHLESGADAATFKAFLNENEITDRFTFDPDLNVMKAQVDTGDGLLIGLNRMSTKVSGEAQGFPFSDTDGRFFHVDEGGVATNRDDKGVWFITGPEDASIYEIHEAMGYAVATDRLWQMELNRRVGHGRLSEIQGSSLTSTDIYLRTLGYSDEELLDFFDAADPEAQEMTLGFVAGINRRIADLRANPEHVPLEFTLIDLNKLMSLDFTPTLQDWTVVDVLGWVSVLQRNFDREATSQREINNAALLQDLQDDFPADYMGMFNDLRWLNDPDALTYIPSGGGGSILAPMAARAASASAHPPARGEASFPDLREVAERMAETRENVVESLESINAYVKMGSYAWVVSGEKTSSGNPIIYSGPQMGFDVPSIVTEGSIRAGGIEVSGMTVPGVPSLIISRTPHHAFSMQVGHANTVDYYIEDPADVFLQRTETIKVLGGDDIELPVYRSSHGPIISPMPYNPATYNEASDGPIISWKYSHWGHEFDSFSAFIKLVRATSMDEFGEGIDQFPVSQHFCYADRDGNIAYWMSGYDPVRPTGEWRLPQGFLGDPVEWDGDVLIPRSTDRNTSQGFYSGWNNKTAASYDANYGPFHRAQVVHDYLSTHDDLSFEDLRGLALNIATTDSFGSGGNPWAFVEDYFTAVVNADPTPERQAALAVMDGWDGHFVAGGPTAWAFGTDRADAWVLMDAWIRETIRLTFEDELGSGESKETLFNVILHGLPGTTINNNYNWFQNLSDPGAPQNADDLILAALDNTIATLGSQPWGIGARGEITFDHPVLAIIGSGLVHTIPFSSRSTYAHCVEFGPEGPVRIESMFQLGESGIVLIDPLSISPVLHPHFLSMTEVYDGFVHRPFPLFD